MSRQARQPPTCPKLPPVPHTLQHPVDAANPLAPHADSVFGIDGVDETTPDGLRQWAISMGFRSSFLAHSPMAGAVPDYSLSPETMSMLFKGQQLAPIWDFLVRRVCSRSDAQRIRDTLRFLHSSSNIRLSPSFLQYSQELEEQNGRIAAKTVELERLKARHEELKSTVARETAEQKRCRAEAAAKDHERYRIHSQLSEERRRALVLAAVKQEALDLAQITNRHNETVEMFLQTSTSAANTAKAAMTIDLSSGLNKVFEALQTQENNADGDEERIHNKAVAAAINALEEKCSRVEILLSLAKSARDTTIQIARRNRLTATAGSLPAKPSVDASKVWTAAYSFQNKLEEIIHATTKEHVDRFQETETLRESIRDLSERCEDLTAELNSNVNVGFDISLALREADEAGHWAALSAVQVYANDLDGRLEEARKRSGDLAELSRRVFAIQEELSLKNDGIQRLISAIQDAIEDAKNFASKSSTVLEHTIALVHRKIAEALPSLLAKYSKTLAVLQTVPMENLDLESIPNAPHKGTKLAYEETLFCLGLPLYLPQTELSVELDSIHKNCLSLQSRLELLSTLNVQLNEKVGRHLSSLCGEQDSQLTAEQYVQLAADMARDANQDCESLCLSASETLMVEMKLATAAASSISDLLDRAQR